MSLDRFEHREVASAMLPLAVCGWSWAEAGQAPDVLTCRRCRRSLGLWNFAGAAPAASAAAAGDGPSGARGPLDPLQEHWWYCPVRMAAAGDPAGWLDAHVRQLVPAASGPGTPHSPSPKESVQRVRSLLGDAVARKTLQP